MLVYVEKCLFISFTGDIFMGLIMEGQRFYKCMDIEAEANFFALLRFLSSQML